MKSRLLAFYILSISFLLTIAACQKSAQKKQTKDVVAEFYKGADISWVTEMEASNVKFYNKDGVSMDCFALMKSLGMNTIRLRAWVNPVNQWSSTADVIAKAKRAKALDMRLLIDLHYSDSWADPGKQNKPVLWASANFSQLNDSVSVYTTRLMNELKGNGIIPDWVQVGNETDNGLLWPDAKASTNMVNYAAIIKTGCIAVKSVFPDTKTMVHVSNGYNNDLFKWNIGGLIKNGAVFDMIGMSLYPSPTDWTTKNDQILYNMNNMVELYGKEIMVVEVGMPWDSPNECKLFLTDLIAKVKSVNNKKGIGVLYWEPQSYNNWNGYTLGAFDASGKPSVALSVFLN
jgi:arabinogalactan endo-1,4-beta-galactosidase